MDSGRFYDFICRPENKLAVLASVSADGLPQAALVGIAVTPDLEIIFDTVNTSRKFKNLQSNPAAAFVIGCRSEATLQFEGLARQLRGAEADRYKMYYFAAWPDGTSRLQWPGISYFVVTPRWIRFSDYSKTPPQIEEMRFD